MSTSNANFYQNVFGHYTLRPKACPGNVHSPFCVLTDGEDELGQRKVDKWQDKISSGFDRLMSFASTELDKRRRSTEGASQRGGDSAASCNTSHDSGIGHGDPPPPPPAPVPAKKRSQSEIGGNS